LFVPIVCCTNVVRGFWLLYFDETFFFNVNFSKDELKIETCKTQESVRRMIYKVMANEKDNKYFKGEDTDDENIYDSDCLSDDGKKSDS